MKKLKLYLDTSVINFAVSENPQLKIQKEATNTLLYKINSGVYEGYISELVIEEIEKANAERREVLKEVVRGTKLTLLKSNQEIEALADKYISEGLIPVKYRDDAVHIAIAVVHEIKVITSWNFEHMVKLKTKTGVKGINELMGYEDVEIITPQEVE